MPVQILVIEHTQYTHTVNFNCIQICVALPYRIEYRCTAQSCQSRCVVYRRASTYVYAIPYGSVCNAEIQTQLKFTVYTPVLQQSVWREGPGMMPGPSLHTLCTQALPRLTFHCRTVEMGDKVTRTHTHSQSHTQSHTVAHTLTCTIDKVCVYSHLKNCASGRGTQVPTSTHHAHALMRK